MRLTSEAKKFAADRALKPTIQLTDNGFSNRHFGLWSPTFSSGGSKLLFISDRDGAPNFYQMDLRTFESTQITDAKGIFAAGAWYVDSAREIFYWERTAIKAVNIDTLEERIIYDEGYQGGPLSASADGALVAFGTKCDDIPGFDEECDGRWALMVVSTRGDGSHPALNAPFPINGVQFSPTDSNMIIYCWEGAARDVPQRIWTSNVNGVLGGPLGQQGPNEARAGAFFTVSGERVGYYGSRFGIRNSDGAFFVEETAWTFGLMKPDGSGETQFECHGPTGQCQMNYAEDILVCSQGAAPDPGSQAVALLRPVGRGGAVFDPIFYHGAKDRLQWVAPRFRPGDEDVVFTSDFSGHADIFLTSVA